MDEHSEDIGNAVVGIKVVRAGPLNAQDFIKPGSSRCSTSPRHSRHRRRKSAYSRIAKTFWKPSSSKKHHLITLDGSYRESSNTVDGTMRRVTARSMTRTSSTCLFSQPTCYPYSDKCMSQGSGHQSEHIYILPRPLRNHHVN